MPNAGLEAVGASRNIENAAGIFAASDHVPTENERATEVDEVDLSRANEYRLLAHLLRQPPSSDELRKSRGTPRRLGAPTPPLPRRQPRLTLTR
jgi:hypothetical protein